MSLSQPAIEYAGEYLYSSARLRFRCFYLSYGSSIVAALAASAATVFELFIIRLLLALILLSTRLLSLQILVIVSCSFSILFKYLFMYFYAFMNAGTVIVFVLVFVFIFAIVPFLLPVIFPILQDISKKTNVGTKPNAIHVMDSNIFSIGINMYV
jgi:hypothetical protein